MENFSSPNESSIYPYIVPVDYPVPEAMARAMGHGLRLTLVFNSGNIVRNVTSDDLVQLGLSQDQAFERAVGNLELLAKAGSVKATVFPSGPGNKPFALFGGHWSAATCLLLPNLFNKLKAHLKSEILWASIPHRDALLIFPSGDEDYRQTIATMIKEKEGDGAKPLTFNLFELTQNGLRELPA